MGTASKVVSVILRCTELISAAIVCGLVGEYLHYFAVANAHAESRVVYTIAMAGISLLFSLLLFPPLMYSFYAFPLDYVLFICWMVAFGLLANLSGGASCDSTWYWNYWGYYWGGWYYTVPVTEVTQSLVGTSACAKWRAVLAWSFIGGMTWLGSGILGTYVIIREKYEADIVYDVNVSEHSDPVHKASWFHRKTSSNSHVAQTDGVDGGKSEAV